MCYSVTAQSLTKSRSLTLRTSEQSRYTDSGAVSLHFAIRVIRRRREMYIGHARLCVCLCVCVPVPRRIPTLLHRPGCNLGEW